MRSSSEKINSSCTEELSWTDEESGSDHSLAENEVRLYGLLHHEQQDSTVPETALDITTSSRTKANRLNRVQYVTQQRNGMASRKSFELNHCTKNNVSTFNGCNPNRFNNKRTDIAAKNPACSKKRKRPARLKNKRKVATSVQSLLKQVYKLSAETSVDNVITLYDKPQEQSTPLSSLSINVNFNASNDCSSSTAKVNCIQSDASIQAQPVSESSGANVQPRLCINDLPEHSPQKDSSQILVSSKYKMQLNHQKRTHSLLFPDIITLDSDNESIDSIIEVKPPTPPPPLVISIDSSDESSKISLEKNQNVKSFSKSNYVPTPEYIDRITTTTNDDIRNVTAETELNPVTPEDSTPPVTSGDNENAELPACNENAELPACNENAELLARNEDSVLPAHNDDTPLPAGNEDVIPVSEEDTSMLICNVVNELPGTSTDSPVFVGESVKRRKYSGLSTTPRSWTKRMTKFYCDSWGGHNFDHQKIISQMSESSEKWFVKDADFRPQVKNRRFCNRCKQRGHLQWDCFEEKKVPLCFMCGGTGHSEPWCPNKICLVCGRPSGSFLYGCQSCYFENKSCAACGEKGHYVWQCPTAWRSYHATTSMGGGLMPEVLKDYHNQECCKCAKRGHSAFWCTSVHDTQLSRQLPSRSLGNRNRSMGRVAHNPNRFNNVRVGPPPSNITQKTNKQAKMKQRYKGGLSSRKEQAKQRKARQKLRKAEKLSHVNV